MELLNEWKYSSLNLERKCLILIIFLWEKRFCLVGTKELTQRECGRRGPIGFGLIKNGEWEIFGWEFVIFSLLIGGWRTRFIHTLKVSLSFILFGSHFMETQGYYYTHFSFLFLGGLKEKIEKPNRPLFFDKEFSVSIKYFFTIMP